MHCLSDSNKPEYVHDEEEFDQEFEDSINRIHHREDWLVLTRGNRTNHAFAELLIYEQAARAEQELSCDNEYVEKQPSRSEALAYLREEKEKKKEKRGA